MEIIWQVGEDNLEDPRTTQHHADKSIAGAWAFGAFAEAGQILCDIFASFLVHSCPHLSLPPNKKGNLGDSLSA